MLLYREPFFLSEYSMNLYVFERKFNYKSQGNPVNTLNFHSLKLDKKCLFLYFCTFAQSISARKFLEKEAEIKLEISRYSNLPWIYFYSTKEKKKIKRKMT